MGASFCIIHVIISLYTYPECSVGKESSCNAGDPSSIPGSERSAGEGIGYLLQYSWAYPVVQLVKYCLQCGRLVFNPWVGKIPCRGNGKLLQDSCLGNPMDRGTWQDTRESDNLVTKQQQKERSPHNLCSSFQFRSVAQMCRTLGDPMDCSRPGLPVHHQLPELAQTHVH